MNLFDAMVTVGIPIPFSNLKPTSTGFHRYGKNNRYWLRQLDGVAFFGDHQTGESHYWFADNNKLADAKQIAERKAKLMQLQNQQREEKEYLYAKIASECERIWNAMDTTGTSTYLESKQVAPFNVRFHNNNIVIPLRDVANKLWSLQTIYPDGSKRFSTGSKKRGFFHTIGKIGELIIVGEGYATLASIYMATGVTCVVAFDAGNLELVIEALVHKYPDLIIIIAADDDRWKPEIGNVGRTKACDIARRFGCIVALPVFKDITSKPTDWNDLHVLEGLETVKSQMMEVLHVSQ